VRVLAKIPARSSADLRAGALRRRDLEAFGELLDGLGPARSVLITGEAQGRRNAAAGLAAVAAARGTRTALLECDLVTPGLADALGIARAPGLHEYLLGSAEAQQILKPLVLAGPASAQATEPLVCVAAGRPAAAGTALLASERFGAAVSNLSEAYELLVIDGPPPGRPHELLAAMACAETTLAFVDSAERQPGLPAPVDGLLVEA
jgi:MinD-like ATPase involved in chromosome partitioning or flagellar assembly